MHFKSRNGIEITGQIGGDLYIHTQLDYKRLSKHELDGLAEVIQRKRDNYLGRWRWPEDTNYVVYPIGSDGPLVRVLNEGTGAVYVYDPLTVAETDIITVSRKAARAYFAAHPTRQPIRVQVEKLGGGWADVIEYSPGDESQRLSAEDKVRRLSTIYLQARIVEGGGDE